MNQAMLNHEFCLLVELAMLTHPASRHPNFDVKASTKAAAEASALDLLKIGKLIEAGEREKAVDSLVALVLHTAEVAILAGIPAAEA